MEKSDTIGKLAEALAKAQGAIEGAKKDQNNPFFRSKYADLSSVWEACRKPLSDNGLAVIQVPLSSHGDDNVLLQTVMTHSSGEWISGIMAMKPVKSDPQGVGSCLTYLRRYCLSAFVGVAPEDDDGNAASQPNKTPVARQEPQPTNPMESKKYDMHPSEPMDVPLSTGMDEQSLDEATLIADKKKAISDKMLGFKVPQKKEFYSFVMEGKPETLDKLQDFLDRYMEYRTAYLKSKGE
jgi:hypothetical protein